MNKFRETSSLQANLSQLEATLNANRQKPEELNQSQTSEAANEKAEPPPPVVSPNKWPLKPGVLVHVNSNHTLSPKNQARLQAQTKKPEEEEAREDEANLGLLERNKKTDEETKTEYSKTKPRRHTQSVVTGIFKNLRKKSDNDSDDSSGKYKKINKSNKRALSLMNLNKSGYTLPKNRLRSLFQSETPNVIVTEGVVSFKRPDRIAASIKPFNEPQKATRKRKKPGDSPPTNGVDNVANGALADNPGLYENLPFHGLQQPPNKPVQVIQPRIVESIQNQKTTKGIEALQKQLTTNPSFTPRIVCPPFVQNAVTYPMNSPSNPIQTTFGIPVLSPIQQMYPLHQTVLLNSYLPQMQASFLKQFPTIDEESEPNTKKFSSLNTRNVRKLPQFQSMRVVRKRNIERFYPNTEYGENFTEINNNKDEEGSDKDGAIQDIIYANFPSLLKVKSNISGVEGFENLTDSIQVCEESDDQINASTTSLNRPIPAPRTKISPEVSPAKTDHVYVNLSMPLINTKYTKSFDVLDGPVRPSKSVEDVSRPGTLPRVGAALDMPLRTSKSGLPDLVKDSESEDETEGKELDKKDNSKPNIIGATPKRTVSTIPSSSSLVKSVVNQLNEQSGINKVGLPKKQIIAPNKTLQIPKLSEKPIPKKTLVRRSNSVQSSLTDDNAQNTNILQQQYLQKRNHFTNISSKGKNKKNFQIPLQKHHSFCYFQPIRVDKRMPTEPDRSTYNNTIGPLIYQPADTQYYTKTLNRSKDKNNQKLNRLKKSESLREKLSCVGVYDNYEKPDYPEPEYNESERRSYLQLLKGNYISNSTRNLGPEQYNTNFNTLGPKDEKPKHKKLVYADLALGNHNLKFKNTVNSNRHLYDTYTIGNEGSTNKETNSSNYKNGQSSRKGSHNQRSDYATLKFNEIDV